MKKSKHYPPHTIPDIEEELFDFSSAVFKENARRKGVRHGIDCQIVHAEEFVNPPKETKEIPSYHFQRERNIYPRSDEMIAMNAIFDRQCDTDEEVLEVFRESHLTDEQIEYFTGRNPCRKEKE